MQFKGDNDHQVLLKIIRREVQGQVKNIVPTGSNVQFVSNYSYGSGTGGAGAGSFAGNLHGMAFEGPGADPSTLSEVVRAKLIGKGIVYLVDNSTSDQIEIHTAPLNSPIFYIGF